MVSEDPPPGQGLNGLTLKLNSLRRYRDVSVTAYSLLMSASWTELE
jgi:hypothetical protein